MSVWRGVIYNVAVINAEWAAGKWVGGSGQKKEQKTRTVNKQRQDCGRYRHFMSFRRKLGDPLIWLVAQLVSRGPVWFIVQCPISPIVSAPATLNRRIIGSILFFNHISCLWYKQRWKLWALVALQHAKCFHSEQSLQTWEMSKNKHKQPNTVPMLYLQRYLAPVYL